MSWPVPPMVPPDHELAVAVEPPRVTGLSLVTVPPVWASVAIDEVSVVSVKVRVAPLWTVRVPSIVPPSTVAVELTVMFWSVALVRADPTRWRLRDPVAPVGSRREVPD